jgi:aspartyl-tRNA(Asn)/glutamyl-tRNA(Gln) amidotransferase subunit C
MAITDEDVTKIAALARLKIEQADIAAYANNLSNIINLVDEMDQIDTREIKAMAHPFDNTTRLREDIVSEQDQRDELLAIAPKTESGLYLVPKVIEE